MNVNELRFRWRRRGRLRPVIIETVAASIRPVLRALLFLLLAGCLQEQEATNAGLLPSAAASLVDPVCLPNGLCVHEAFLPFYERHAHLLGSPVSEPLIHRGRLVQYFRAGRVELVPENPPGYQVGLAYLAEEACGRQPPLHYSDVPSHLDRQRRYYPQTGHSLEGEFLRFVEANGGVDFFGHPISQQRSDGEETVQDFVRVQLRRRADGGFYLAPLGALAAARATPPPDLCPSVPADDPYTQPGQHHGGDHDG